MSLIVQASRSARIGKSVVAGAALAAVACLAGCTVHVHEYDERPRGEVVVERDEPPPHRDVVVEREPAVVEVRFEPAPVEVVTTYETDLRPHGRWVTVGAYGRCWVWANRPAGWRPYMYGHWTCGDQGWTWVAEGEEAEWGITCYHYGRWFEDPTEGWVWVPGRVWAPSWVAWRIGGGYSCWAPLPPECGDGYAVNEVVVNRYIRPERFIVVKTEHITNVHIHENIVINNNITIINNTKITNITYNGNRVVNRGPKVADVELAVHHKITVEKATTVHSAEEAREAKAQGKLVMYSPRTVETYTASHPVTKHTATPRVTENKETLTHQPNTPDHETATHKNVNPNATAEEIAAEKEKERQQKLAEEKAAREKAAAEKSQVKENEKETREKTAEEKAAEKAAKENEMKEKTAEEKAAKEKAAQEKMAEKEAKEKAAQEKINEEKANRGKVAEEKAAKEKEMKDKAAEEKAAKEKAAEEEKAAKLKAAEEKAAAEKAAKEKAAEEKAAKEHPQVHTGNNPPPNPNDPNNPNKKKKNPNEQDPNAPK